MARQPHAVAVPLYAEAVTVIFDFVEPVRGVRDDGGFSRKAEVEGAWQGARIGHRGRFCDPALVSCDGTAEASV